MDKTLCGRQSCPGVCERVCHCPAGMARVRWLWFQRRMERGESRARAPGVLSPSIGVDPETGEIKSPKHNWAALNAPLRRRPSKFLPVRYERQAAPPYGRNLKWVTAWPVLTAFLVVMALVLLSAFFVHGPSLNKHYDPDPVNYPPYEWMWEK